MSPFLKRALFTVVVPTSVAVLMPSYANPCVGSA
jgi:hypothetical protein